MIEPRMLLSVEIIILAALVELYSSVALVDLSEYSLVEDPVVTDETGLVVLRVQ